jgi:hypothetical protein
LKMTINQKVRWSFVAVMIATTCVAVLGYTQLSKQVGTMVSIVHELDSNKDISADPGVKMIHATTEKAMADGGRTTQWLVILFLATLGLVIVLASFIPRSITNNLGRMMQGLVQSAQEMASESNTSHHQANPLRRVPPSRRLPLRKPHRLWRKCPP